MSIFDGAIGPAAPGPAEGRAAALAALAALAGEPPRSGRVGAGTGARSGKHRGLLFPGGFAFATTTVGSATLAAVAVVNAWGDIIGAAGERLHTDAQGVATQGRSLNTTLVVVITDARLSKPDCYLLAQSAHDGLARALDPVHTRFDGDAAVCLATGSAASASATTTDTAVTDTDTDLDSLRAATPHVVASAIRITGSRSE
jgi:L-aminopeptidase/D-esterase-like protein